MPDPTSPPWTVRRAYGTRSVAAQGGESVVARWQGHYAVLGPDGEILATVWGDDRPVDAPRPAEANAGLMVAAPELLAACREALGYVERSRYGSGNVESNLRAAIAKAEGRTEA